MEVLGWVGPVVTLLSVGVGAGAVVVQLRRLARDVEELVVLHRNVEGRIDALEREVADLRGRLLERLRAASQSPAPVTPPRGMRIHHPRPPPTPPRDDEDDE